MGLEGMPNEGPIYVPRKPTEDAPAEEPRKGVQRGTLSLVLSLSGLLVVLGGSGGFLAEIYHTGLAFSQSHAEFLSEANQTSAEGIALLVGSAAKAVGVLNASAQESAGIKVAAEAESTTTKVETAVGGEASLAIQRGNRQLVHDTNEKMIFVYEEAFVKFQDEVRESTKNPDAKIFVILRMMDMDDDCIPRDEAIPVPFPDRSALSRFLAFKCVLVPGMNDSVCSVNQERRVNSPTEVSVANRGFPSQITVPATDSVLQHLQRARMALEDLEQVLLYNAFDLGRFKESGTLPSETVKSVNAELSRVRSGLVLTRSRIEAIKELQAVLPMRNDELSRAWLLTDLAHRSVLKGSRLEPVDETSIRTWIEKMPSELETEAFKLRDLELNRRSGAGYRSIRPFLANIWEAFSSRSFGLGGWLGHEPLPSEQEQVSSKPELRLPTIPVALLLLALVAVPVWRFLSTGSFWRANKIAWLVPCALAVIVFPVHSSFVANTSTRAVGKSVTDGVVPEVVKGWYQSRADTLVAEAGERAAGLKAQAHAEGEVMKNAARRAKIGRLGCPSLYGVRSINAIELGQDIMQTIPSYRGEIDDRLAGRLELLVSGVSRRIRQASPPIPIFPPRREPLAQPPPWPFPPRAQ